MPKMVNFAMFLKTRKLKWDILDDFQTLWKLGQVTTYLSKSVVKSLCFVRRIRNDKLRMIRWIKCYNSIWFQNPFTFWEKWFEIKILNCSSGSDQGHRLVFKHWHFFSCRNPKRQIQGKIQGVPKEFVQNWSIRPDILDNSDKIRKSGQSWIIRTNPHFGQKGQN